MVVVLLSGWLLSVLAELDTRGLNADGEMYSDACKQQCGILVCDTLCDDAYCTVLVV